MSDPNDAWAAQQRRRVMRPNAQLYMRPDAQRFLPSEPPRWATKEEVRLFWGDRADEREAKARAEQAAAEAELDELLRLKRELAEIKSLLRLRRKLRDIKAFNPEQPRVPAGGPHGGQWVSEGAQGTPTQIAGPAPGIGHNQRPVLNRHIVENHVGKTDDELNARIRREQFRGVFVTIGRDRNGSFDSMDSANDFIRRTIENNPEMVSGVGRGESQDAFLTWRFG